MDEEPCYFSAVSPNDSNYYCSCSGPTKSNRTAADEGRKGTFSEAGVFLASLWPAGQATSRREGTWPIVPAWVAATSLSSETQSPAPDSEWIKRKIFCIHQSLITAHCCANSLACICAEELGWCLPFPLLCLGSCLSLLETRNSIFHCLGLWPYTWVKMTGQNEAVRARRRESSCCWLRKVPASHATWQPSLQVNKRTCSTLSRGGDWQMPQRGKGQNDAELNELIQTSQWFLLCDLHCCQFRFLNSLLIW